MSHRISSRYLNFSNEEDLYLIHIVQKHPALYDISDKFYRDFLLRSKSWQAVASKMNKSVEECKKRWRSMKDTYFRFKRKNPKTSWVLMKRLHFLEPAGRIDGTTTDETCNQQEENPLEEETQAVGDESTMDNFQEPTTSQSQNRLYYEEMPAYDQDSTSESKYRTGIGNEHFIRLIEQNARDHEDIKSDPVFAFFHSMALTVKNLPPELVAEARVKICEVVGNLEMKAIRMMGDTYTDENIKIEEEESAVGD